VKDSAHVINVRHNLPQRSPLMKNPQDKIKKKRREVEDDGKDLEDFIVDDEYDPLDPGVSQYKDEIKKMFIRNPRHYE